jgi:pimeloyl-ACP methyl ester carboxylesterase
MAHLKKVLTVIFVLSLLGFFALGNEAVNVPNHHHNAFKVVKTLSKIAEKVEITQLEISLQWTWIQMDIYDETVPITVDIIASNFKKPEKILYMLPGGGVNFKSSYFTPINNNMAHFFREQGYLVVGISPREDNVPAGITYEFMADWGLLKHKQDIRKIVNIVQHLFNKKYDMLGHSYGAVYALDYAGTYSGKLNKIMVMDIDFYDPEKKPEAIALHQLSYQAYGQLMADGIYTDPFVAEFKQMAAMLILYPLADSGVSREMLGLPGNFTLEGLFYFGAIYTGIMPGPITHITGAPGDWSLVQGTLAGYYFFDIDPLNDEYGFTLCEFDTMIAALNESKSGFMPIALHRDFSAAASYSGIYDIDWAGIKEKVIWVNMELGYGDRTYGADLIKQNGNANVRVIIVPGYAHGDVLWSSTAYVDVWPLLLE